MSEISNIDKLRNFILSNNDWEKILSSDPYNLSVKRDLGYVLLKYNQITSDMSTDYARAARGVILDEENQYCIVCRPFEKFFNWGESRAADIDWDSAFIQEKIDGSILKMWVSNKLEQWVISTNGVIMGSKVPVMFPKNGIKTFGDMVEQIPEHFWTTNNFDEEYTYIFEIVGPQNRVVVPYDHINMYYLSSFHNESGEEKRFSEEDLHYFSRPKTYSFSSLEETINFTKSESFNDYKNEGFVVTDKFSNRIKIKTEDYLRIHRLRGEAIPTDKKILDIVIQGETEEFLSYFPEYKDQFLEVETSLQNFKRDLQKQKIDLESKTFDNRKQAAMWIKNEKDPNFLFQAYDGKVDDIDEWVKEQRLENLVRRILS